MLFLRGFGHHLAIVLISHVYFDIVYTTEDCKAGFRQVLVKRERGRPCVYQQSGVRFIGWRFSLNQGQQAIAAFERLGVDYEQFKTSPDTPSDESCECSRVPCLNKRQMNKLLDLSVNKTLQTILALVPSFKNLCCSLQRPILILAFTSGGRIFSDFASSDIEYHIKMQSWQVLSQGLNQTKWCRNYQEVCAEQTRTIADGCVDRGVRDDKRAIDDDSKDSARYAENTCREGSTVRLLPTRRVQVSPVDMRSTAMMNSLIFVKPSTYAPKDRLHTSRHIPMGTTFVTPINVGDFERNSQFASKPYVQISGMRKKPLFSTYSSLFTINFLAPVSSSAMKSLEKDAPFRLSVVASTTGNGQGYFDSISESANILASTHGTSEYRDGKSSAASSFSLTPSLKFVAQTEKPSSVILSNSLRNISRTGWSSSPPEAESASLRRLSFETSPSQMLQTNTSLNVALELSSPTILPAMVHKDWSFPVTPSVKFATAEKAKPASVIQNKPLKIPRTWFSSSLEAKPRVSLKSSWQLQKTSFRRTSYMLNAMVPTSLLGLTESILSTAPASETPNNAELSFETFSNKVLHTKTSLKFALTPSVTFKSEIVKPSSVIIVNNALKISKTWSTPLSTKVGERVSFTSSWSLQQISLYRTNFVLETGVPSSSLGPKSLFSATSTSKTTVRPDLSFETSSSLGLKYLVTATSASKTYNGTDLSLETFLSEVPQSNMSLRFAVLNSSTTTVLIHHKLDLSPQITSTQCLTSKAMLSQLFSSMAKTWFAHVQQKSEHIGASRQTWLSKIAVKEMSIRPTYHSTSPSSLSSRVIVNYSRSSEILAQSLPSATQNISSKLTAQASDHLDPALLPGTTKSFKNSAGFSSTIQGRVSIRISRTLSKSSRSQPVNPWRSYNPSICSSSYSSVRAPVNISSLSSTYVAVSSLLFLHTHSSVLSKSILDVKSIALSTLLPWMTSQTGHTVSTVSNMRTMDVSLSIRTRDVITWTSSLSPSTTSLHSPSNAITTSPDDKTLAISVSVSAKKLSNSATIGVVSTKMGRIHRNSSAASSLGSTLVLHLQRTSLQHKSSALDLSRTPTWAKTTTLQQSAETKSGTPLPSSHGLVSTASVPFPKSLSAHTTLIPSLIRRTVISHSFASSELSAVSSVSPGFSRYDQAFLLVFSGNCAMLDNKDDFTEQLKAVLSQLLAIHTADISIRRISCGSVHVLFSIREAKGRNIINKLTGIVQDEGFKFEYNNMIFVALDVSEVSKLPPNTTVRPSRTNGTPRTTEVKQIALIIFIFVVGFFAALAVFLGVVFCARFCRCCQVRHQKRRQNLKQTPADVELKVFSSLYLNRFRKVDYYGGSQQVTPSKGRQEECEHEDNDIQPAASTVTALLSKNRNVPDLEEKQLNFDDKDSCSSVLFY